MLLLFPQPARAAGPLVVGDGTAASCTEIALKDALLVVETLGSASLRFDCGPAPVTIGLSQATRMPGTSAFTFLVVPDGATLEGAGLVTLQGQYSEAIPEATMVFVAADTEVALTGLNVVDGRGGPQAPGGIMNLGTLTLGNSLVSGHRNVSGGAGIQNSGTLTIVDSTVADNHSRGGGGGVDNAGTLNVRRSMFRGNGTTDGGGGAILNSGTLTIDDSGFSGNQANREGGALLNAGAGILTIRRSTLSENSTVQGGAIANHGTLVVQNSTFSANIAGLGGAMAGVSGSLHVDQSAFSGNDAGSGGGLRTYPGSTALVTHSTFDGNTAARTATAEGAAIASFGALTIQQSALSGNAGALGGGIFNGAALALQHSAITGNTASVGGGVYICVEGQEAPFSGAVCRGTLSLTNSVISGNIPDDIVPSTLAR
jgi:hypothetical protein